MPYHVFISHGSEDAYVIDHLIGPKLQATGAEVFIDRGQIALGDNFRTKVLTALGQTDELFVLLTVSSIERPWVFAEIGAAAVAQKRIVPVRYGPNLDQLQKLGILSLLGNVRPIKLEELDQYVTELRQRVGN